MPEELFSCLNDFAVEILEEQPMQPLADMPQPMHQWTLANGICVAGDSWGNEGESKRQIIFLHGLGQTRHAWRKAARVMARHGYHTITVDARGHGDSSWAADADYGFDALAEDLRLLIAVLGNRSPMIVGASMGGSTSLIGAGTGMLAVSGLVLVDVVPQTSPAGVARIHRFMQETRHGFSSLEEVSRSIVAYKGQPYQGTLEGLKKNVRRAADGRLHWHWDPAVLQRTVTSVQTRIACARKIKVPIMLIRGADSDVVTSEAARQFIGLCPHAVYVDIIGVGHMIAGDDNEQFSGVLLEFAQAVMAANEN